MSVVLSEHLPLLATAPDGIAKLRNLILGLAISGKLVAQNPDEPPAKVVFDRFRIPRKKPAERLLKKFTLPSSWLWCEIGDLNVLRTGATPSTLKTENYGGEIRWLVSGDIHKREITDCDGRISEQGLASSNCKVLPENSVLIALNGQGKTRATVAILRVPAACNQSLIAMTPVSEEVLLPEFLYLNLRFRYYEIRDITGQKQRRGLNMGLVADLSISLPPVAEQQRIVAKVDELMALCDRLEAEQADATSAHARLVETLLGTLTQSTDVAEFTANWQRLAEHFDTLFTTEASIDALKQTVLQLAVMGKLVSQDPNNEPASTLLKQIEQVRAQLVAEGVCKKAKPALSVSDDEQPFVIPENWHWSRLASLVSVLGDGLHGTPHYTPGTPYFFVNGNNLVNGEIVIKPETKTVSETEFLKHSKPLSTSTVLVSINGSLGRVAFYAGEQVILGKSACFFNLLPPLNKRYIRLVLESPYFVTYAFRSATGTTIKNLGLKAMNDFPIPLPPIAEQHRIVAKVDELMALCERLKVDLGTARQRQAALADTLIESALEAA